jgi:hypothetical protein
MNERYLRLLDQATRDGLKAAAEQMKTDPVRTPERELITDALIQAMALLTTVAGDYERRGDHRAAATCQRKWKLLALAYEQRQAEQAEKAELVWEGKYDAAGRRVAPLRVSLLPKFNRRKT